ncbi:MAG: FeoB-associated Cys-rich membrane protein [Thermicanus sp.]|nr:FeoB-associated Cys-rich membrane protein [Thermicanus sp.]
MWANLIIGGLIFGYAGWTLFRHLSRSREGKCAACSMKKTCDQCALPSKEKIRL